MTTKAPKRDKTGKFVSAGWAKKKTSSPRPRRPSTGNRPTAQDIVAKSAAVTPTPPAPPPLTTTHVAFVLDCSGSMGVIWEDVVREMTKNFNTVRAESIRAAQQTDLSLVAFGSRVNVVFENQPLSTNMLPSTLRPNMGGTVLYKATLDAIDVLERNPDRNDYNTSCLVLVFTDGDENESQMHMTNPAGTLRNRIAALQRTDRWSFAFVVPPGRKSTITHGLGLPEGNVMEWETTRAGTEHAGRAIQSGISRYYVSRAAGSRSTKGFFTTDLSKVSAATVQRNLIDIKDRVKIFTVPREIAIREFVEQQMGSYVLGTAYYQLSKDELVQAQKDVLVMEKGKREVYGGANARQLLGLPAGDVKLRPGNHANLEIFVRSDSVNRRLVRGTKLIVMR